MAIAAGVDTHAAATSGTSITTPAVTTQASGSIFIIAVITSGTVTSVEDSKSNSYTEIETVLGGIGNTSMYYVENGTGGASHTFTANIDTSAFNTIFAFEITGAATSGALDQSGRQSDATEAYTSTSETTTQAAEMLVSVIFEDPGTAQTHTEGTGFTIVEEETNGGSTVYCGALAYRIVASTGTYNSSWTLGANTTSHVWIVTFKEAAAGGAVQMFLLTPARTDGLGYGGIFPGGRL